MARQLALLLLLLLAPTTAPAQEAPRFALPLECDFATLCYVQNYVDLDPGPGFADPTCGPLGYDGDRGTDLAVPTLTALRAGVTVRAAADGVVKAIRDGEPENFDLTFDPEAIRGREAGNAVLLDHGGGWETQYNHLQEGSVAVTPGERVRREQPLGRMGLSGRTQFPHLEFAVRKDGTAIDPFTGRDGGGGCGTGGDGLWTAEAQAALAYRPGGIQHLGFATQRPSLLDALDGAYDGAPSAESPALVGWAVAWGLRAGDREYLRLIGPNGQRLAERQGEIPDTKARWFSFAGLRRPPQGWPAGTYRVEYRLERDGATLALQNETFALP
jgi:murein DD-endopeptidase MepM/ murein hydrolase activator NlpD